MCGNFASAFAHDVNRRLYRQMSLIRCRKTVATKLCAQLWNFIQGPTHTSRQVRSPTWYSRHISSLLQRRC